MITYLCPHCDSRFQVADDSDEYKLPCPNCNRQLDLLDLTGLMPIDDAPSSSPESAEAGMVIESMPKVVRTGALPDPTAKAIQNAISAAAAGAENAAAVGLRTFRRGKQWTVDRGLPALQRLQSQIKEKTSGNKKIAIPDKANRMEDCAQFILDKYQSTGYGVQRLAFDEDGIKGILVQIRNSTSSSGSIFRTITGTTSCATLKLSAKGEDLLIEVMAGKWIDKVEAAVVSWFVLWPLLFTAAFGAFRQKAFLDRVYNDTIAWFATNS